MLQPCEIDTDLKEHLNQMTPKAYTPKSLLGSLPLDSGPTPKIIFLHANTAHELYNTHDLTLVF